MAAGLKTIILLSFVLALGFLLVILSCALFANWLPLLVALTFVFAPLPNALCTRCAGQDDFSADYNSAYVDFGNWLTSGTVVMGFALPITLAHAGVIHETAGLMSIVGGALVYGTILTYSGFFSDSGDDLF
ncbi:vacuolar protein sorting 55 [Acaromyces ingoldii]|uniref:Vacuolar protein sorting 55 n=1 Tax=Acaromyces ingoldii TaxID=215250 RepID=A0A316YST8_9BASI|nr:vacuolar protein sorting 55 [Acaromyces ingoldii]PWN92301.1 vacuolar protein sorting 55 [Acaromyces ingoldii]